MSVMSRTSLVYYRGIDELRGGERNTGYEFHGSLLCLIGRDHVRVSWAVMAKAALAELGVLPHATLRIALLEPQLAHPRLLRDALATIPMSA
jgi:4-hydroxy-tetrahydrodipicolinate synthase